MRIPLTAQSKFFSIAAEMGRRVIWLHTFGERFADAEIDCCRFERVAVVYIEIDRILIPLPGGKNGAHAGAGANVVL